MTEVTQQVCKVLIKAPIQDVWNALTKEGEVLPFFFGSVMHTTGLKPGAQLRMRTPNGKFTGVVGEILECNPPYRFSHTFRFTNFDDPPCVVIYELKEVEGGSGVHADLGQSACGDKDGKEHGSGRSVYHGCAEVTCRNRPAIFRQANTAVHHQPDGATFASQVQKRTLATGSKSLSAVWLLKSSKSQAKDDWP